MSLHRYFFPDFLEIQRESFLNFLKQGILEEFSKRNPITNRNNTIEIFFYPEYFCLTKPDYSVQQAIFLKKSYTSKLYIPVQFTDKKKKNIFLKWILIAQLPLMTKRGHFVLNGAARVVMNQLVRSPGVYFRENFYEIYLNKWISKPNKILKRFYADIICLKGTWIRIEIDKDFCMWVRLKKGPKIPLLWFLLGMGLNEKIIFQSIISPNFLLKSFQKEKIKNPLSLYKRKFASNLKEAGSFSSNQIAGVKVQSFFERSLSQTNSPNFIQKSGNMKKKEGKIFMKYPYVSTTPEAWKEIAKLFSLKKSRGSTKRKTGGLEKKFASRFLLSKSGRSMQINNFKLFNNSFANFWFQKKNSETKGSTLNNLLWEQKAFSLKNVRPLPPKTLNIDSKKIFGNKNSLQTRNLNKTGNFFALSTKDILSDRIEVQNLSPKMVLKSAKLSKFQEKFDNVTLGRKWFFQRFMNPRMYDLGKKGRLALNKKLGLTIEKTQTTLTAIDLLFITNYLMKVEKGLYPVDDIDHLKNKRIRSAGELIQMQFGIGLMRLEKTIRLKLNTKSKKRKTFYQKIRKGNKNAQNSVTTNSSTRIFPFPGAGARSFVKSKDGAQKWKGDIAKKFYESFFYRNGFFHEKKIFYRKNKSFNRIRISKPSIIQTFSESFWWNSYLNRRKLKEKLTPKLHKSWISLNSSIEPKYVNGALKEFFGTHPLSQFMDQINPLSEITHKRRLSSLGPGGVSRDSATLAIRGIHPSHYGRICPIETPEGKNTGLVNSLTVYARVNTQGLIEAPFYSLYKGQIQKSLGKFYLSAEQEEHFQTATPDLNITKKNFLPKQKIPIRFGKNFFTDSPKDISFIGVSPLQMISLATSLIPFLEHDDANRALMGSNMQRQAVPLIRPQRPFVGTGLEAKAASDSGHALTSSQSGFVLYASSSEILVFI